MLVDIKMFEFTNMTDEPKYLHDVVNVSVKRIYYRASPQGPLAERVIIYDCYMWMFYVCGFIPRVPTRVRHGLLRCLFVVVVFCCCFFGGGIFLFFRLRICVLVCCFGSCDSRAIMFKIADQYTSLRVSLSPVHILNSLVLFFYRADCR